MSLNAPSGGNVSSPHHSRLHWSSHSHSLAPRNVQKVEWLPVCVTQRRVKKQNGVKCTKTWDWIYFSRWITPFTAFFLGDLKKNNQQNFASVSVELTGELLTSRPLLLKRVVLAWLSKVELKKKKKKKKKQRRTPDLHISKRQVPVTDRWVNFVSSSLQLCLTSHFCRLKQHWINQIPRTWSQIR